MGFVNIGFGNFINTDKIITIVTPDSAPAKRMVQTGKESGTVVDATQGRRTRGILVTDEHIILSSLLPETIVLRIRNGEGKEDVL